MSAASSRSHAFTLIEALVAIALVGIGLVAVMQGLVAINRTEAIVRQNDRMHRLAAEKLDELIVTGETVTTQEGDFRDRGIEGFRWEVLVEPTGVVDLNAVTVSVESDQGRSVEVSTLQYTPPTTGGTQ